MLFDEQDDDVRNAGDSHEGDDGKSSNLVDANRAEFEYRGDLLSHRRKAEHLGGVKAHQVVRDGRQEIEQSKHIEESEQKKENNDCFVIEDYFSGEKNKEIAKKIVENIKEKIENINPKERGICKYGIYAKNLKNLFKGIKDELVKEEYHTPENMVGFKVLLQKIQNIIEEKEKLEEV